VALFVAALRAVGLAARFVDIFVGSMGLGP
jgi:transglutaminase-like putative cysteine protease